MKKIKGIKSETRQKVFLENLFGANLFSDYDKAEYDYKEFCKENRLKVKLPYAKPANDNEENTNAYEMMKAIIKVENSGKLCNAMDPNQYKYYSWFQIDPKSGFGLSFDGYAAWRLDSVVPARLCFKSRAIAKFAGVLLPELFTDFQLIIE